MVHVIFLTSGEQGGHGVSIEETKRVREQEARLAATVLGYESLEFWGEPDGELQASQGNSDRLRKKLDDWKPDLVYVTHEGEMHPDHRAAAEIVRSAVTGPPSPKKVPAVLMYEVWTPLQKMDVIVDISEYVEIKRSAILAYQSQVAVMTFDEAILCLNRYRGEMHSWPGGDYAEIFVEMSGVGQ